jgi:hypothetical protein
MNYPCQQGLKANDGCKLLRCMARDATSHAWPQFVVKKVSGFVIRPGARGKRGYCVSLVSSLGLCPGVDATGVGEICGRRGKSLFA